MHALPFRRPRSNFCWNLCPRNALAAPASRFRFARTPLPTPAAVTAADEHDCAIHYRRTMRCPSGGYGTKRRSRRFRNDNRCCDCGRAMEEMLGGKDTPHGARSLRASQSWPMTRHGVRPTDASLSSFCSSSVPANQFRATDSMFNRATFR